MNLLEVKIVAITTLGILSLICGLLPLKFRKYIIKKDKVLPKSKKREMILSALLCFGAGVLLAAVMIHILPEVREGFARAKALEAANNKRVNEELNQSKSIQLESDHNHLHTSSQNSGDKINYLNYNQSTSLQMKHDDHHPHTILNNGHDAHDHHEGRTIKMDKDHSHIRMSTHNSSDDENHDHHVHNHTHHDNDHSHNDHHVHNHTYPDHDDDSSHNNHDHNQQDHDRNHDEHNDHGHNDHHDHDHNHNDHHGHNHNDHHGHNHNDHHDHDHNDHIADQGKNITLISTEDVHENEGLVDAGGIHTHTDDELKESAHFHGMTGHPLTEKLRRQGERQPEDFHSPIEEVGPRDGITVQTETIPTEIINMDTESPITPVPDFDESGMQIAHEDEGQGSVPSDSASHQISKRNVIPEFDIIANSPDDHATSEKGNSISVDSSAVNLDSYVNNVEEHTERADDDTTDTSPIYAPLLETALHEILPENIPEHIQEELPNGRGQNSSESTNESAHHSHDNVHNVPESSASGGDRHHHANSRTSLHDHHHDDIDEFDSNKLDRDNQRVGHLEQESHEDHTDHEDEHGYPFTELVVCAGFFIVYFIEEIVHWIFSNGSYKEEGTHHGGHSHLPVKSHLNGNAGINDSSNDKKGYGSRSAWRTPPMQGIDNPVFAGDQDAMSWNPTVQVSAEASFKETPGRCSIVDLSSSESLEGRLDKSSKPGCGLIMMNNIRSLLMVVALSFHSVFEGLAIGLQENVRDTWYLTLAVAAHKLVIQFCIGMEFIVIGASVRAVILYIVVMSLTNPVGASLGMFLTSDAAFFADPKQLFLITILQGFAGGTILYVTFFEILERERNKPGGRFVKFFSLLAGFAFLAVIENFGAHSHAPAESDGGHTH